MSAPLPEVTRLSDSRSAAAVFGFLARYRGDTRCAYGQDLQAFLRWCQDRQLPPLEVERPHLELYLRWMEQRTYAPATMAPDVRQRHVDAVLPSDVTAALTA